MARIKAILEELESTLTLADASELVVAKLIDKLDELDPGLREKFDTYWAKTFLELVVHIVDHCEEQNVADTLYDIEKAPEGLRSRVLRRRLALNLPPGTKNQLSEEERYTLADDMIEAGIATVKDIELWDALWGRKDQWSPVVHIVPPPVPDQPTSVPDQSTSVPDQPTFAPS